MCKAFSPGRGLLHAEITKVGDARRQGKGGGLSFDDDLHLALQTLLEGRRNKIARLKTLPECSRERMIQLGNLHHITPFQGHILGTVARGKDFIQVDIDFCFGAIGHEAIDDDMGKVGVRDRGGAVCLVGFGNEFQERVMID